MARVALFLRVARRFLTCLSSVFTCARVRPNRHLGHDFWNARMVLLGPLINSRCILCLRRVLSSVKLVNAALRKLLMTSTPVTLVLRTLDMVLAVLTTSRDVLR